MPRREETLALIISSSSTSSPSKFYSANPEASYFPSKFSISVFKSSYD
jgi:hypothetical protein